MNGNSEIYNGSQWAHDIILVNKAGATVYITGLSRYEIYSFMRYALLTITELPNNELTSIHTLNLPPLLL